MSGEQFSLGIVFLAGVISFLSPCVLPLLPVYLSLISGMTFEEMQQSDSLRTARWRLIGSAFAFVLGVSVVLVLILGSAASLVNTLSERWDMLQTIIRWVGGIAILVFALHTFGVFRINALLQERRFHLDGKKFGYLGAFIIGGAFAFGWSPCIGPILGGVLSSAASATSPAQSWWLMVAYAMGLGLPFMLTAVFASIFLRNMQRFTRHMRTIEIISGVLLLVMGILLVTDKMELIANMGSYLPDVNSRIEEYLIHD